MTEHASTDSCALRWNALLAEHSILHSQHEDLPASLTHPPSAGQIALRETIAARRAELPKKDQALVEEWARSARR
jgi:hypothetical protein